MNDALLSFFVAQGYSEKQRKKKRARYRWLTRCTKNDDENPNEKANTLSVDSREI